MHNKIHLSFIFIVLCLLFLASSQVSAVSIDADLSQCSGDPTCTWSFGDGSNATGCNSEAHQFGAAGNYDVTLQVDCGAFRQEVTRIVSVKSDDYYKDSDGIIHCDGVGPGNTFTVDGTEYTAVSESTLREWADNYGNHDLSTACTSHVKDMSWLFADASGFNQIIGGWDTSNVSDMDAMFRHAYDFNRNLENWDVSNVTNMSQMFRTTDFNQDIGSWNVSNVTDMSNMFVASKFDHDIGDWNVSNVTDMSGMFKKSDKFNQDLSDWCVSKIEQKPVDFDRWNDSWDKPRPIWGTCPQ